MPPEPTDWVDWHEPYADPRSPLSQRLELVQRHVRAFLDQCTSPVMRVVSLCAGDGRDLLDVVAQHRRAPQVQARLLELDRRLAARAQAKATAAGLDSVDVICADAAAADVYVDAVPFDLVLVCGVFGNISDGDVQRTIQLLPQLCAAGAIVIWTRHRRPPDLTPTIRQWFAAAGFQERTFDSPGPDAWSVGAHAFHGDPQPLAPDARLFTFIR